MYGMLFDPPLAAASSANKLAFALVIGVGVVIIAIGVVPLFWKPTEADPSDETGAAGVKPMPKYRLLLAYLAMAILVVGSFADLIRDSEHWPWSNFPMYSEMEPISDHFDDFRPYGVLANDPTREIALFNDGRYLQPFDPSRLAECLYKFHYWHPEKMDAALMDCAKRYEALRLAGAHSGPQIIGIRLYHETRYIDPMGGNLDDIPPAKDRQLLNEVWLPTAEKKL